MQALELANRYMTIFCDEENPDNLKPILSNSFSFNGPFYTFTSANDYIESLKLDPPIGCKYKTIQAYENETSACLVYEFSKQGIHTTMAQIFEVDYNLINKITLIFDTGSFK